MYYIHEITYPPSPISQIFIIFLNDMQININSAVRGLSNYLIFLVKEEYLKNPDLQKTTNIFENENE